MQHNFNQQAKEHEKETGMSGDRFKFKEGSNRMRIVSPSLKHMSNYKGTLNTKFLTYIIDRDDENKAKLAFLPFKIIQMVGALQASPDYAFTEVPMPYDITVQAANAGTKEVVYSVVPARENTQLTSDEIKIISELKPLEEIHQKLMEKNKIEIQDNPVSEAPLPPANEYGQLAPVDQDEIKVENIPF